MPLTPMDIQQKTFGPMLRGYDMDEVDDFLDEVVATLKDYDQRVRDAQDRIRALETELESRGEQESAISRALLAAQRQADTLLEEARSEAEMIRSQALDEVDRIRADREAERMTLTQDIARMRATVADLKRRIVELAGAAEADLDQMDEAIAAASAEVSESLVPAGNTEPTHETPAETQETEPVAGSSDGPHGDWGVVSNDFEEGEQWEETAASEPPVWERPAVAEAPEGDVPSDASEAEQMVDLSEEDDEVDEAASEESFGGLADELADEASRATDDLSEAAPPTRRPWERGSV